MIRYKRLNESFDPVKTVSMQFRRTLEDSKYGKALRKVDILDETVAIVEEILDDIYIRNVRKQMLRSFLVLNGK